MIPRARLGSTSAVLLAVAALAGLGAVAAIAPGAGRDAASSEPATRVIVNLTVDGRSVHRADQALTLARAARGQGREVVLFLNVDGPRLAAEDAAEDATGSTGDAAGLPGKPTLRAQLRSLIDAGVTVIVARGCAGVCDVDLDGLLAGVRPGTAGEIAGLAADGGVVFSY